MNSPSRRHPDPKPRPSAQQKAAQNTQEAAVQGILQVPSRLAPAFERLLKLVTRLNQAHLPLYLGGGTILACRWGHRISTDLDLYVRRRDIANVGPALHELLQVAVTADPDVFAQPALYGHSHAVMGKVLGTECTLYSNNHLRADDAERERLGDGSILAVTNEEVMLGKIGGRLRMIAARRPMLPIRDLYDISVGGVMDPDAVQAGLASIPLPLRERIADAVENIPFDLHLIDPKPIIAPTWDIKLPGLAQRIAPAVRHASVDLLPPCAPMPPDLRFDSTENGPP